MFTGVESKKRGITGRGEQVRIAKRSISSLPTRSIDMMKEGRNRKSSPKPLIGW
jgi:hypothetical protein